MKNIKMKKILIALDYDPTAQKVAEVGFSLGSSLGAEITLLHVIADPIYYSSPEYSPIMGFTGFIDIGPVQLNSADALKSASLLFLDKTRDHLGNADIKTLVKEGDFAETILDTAKHIHADIIVIGSHSRKWLGNLVMGSVSESVLHQTSIPLFIVPTKKQD
ncbi:MAG: universal stress protein [Bacteroidota bacterium]